ncbi:hypothetical protein BKA70DRAFT_1286117 [Coprinopsis sp. MPI-PUGE-AT-0042]|nr:hypothetical protein BKA70DRAFT_1286117 [Coprinopsis sp. MPI-PUGE-AT-0042]
MSCYGYARRCWGWKSSCSGQASMIFKLTPPPPSKSIHVHPLLALGILKYVVPPDTPDPQPVWKRPKAQVAGRLFSRWKPQAECIYLPGIFDVSDIRFRRGLCRCSKSGIGSLIGSRVGRDGEVYYILANVRIPPELKVSSCSLDLRNLVRLVPLANPNMTSN